MKGYVKKARAAARFGRVTGSVLKIQFFERANRFLASRGWHRRPLTLPLSIVMRTTERCFLKCKMCGQNGIAGRLRDKAAYDRMRIDEGVYASLCEEMTSWPLKPFVKFTGGEPLLEWKTLRPAIERMHAMGCGIKFNTNGVLLKSPRLAEEVVRAGVDYLSVSIDGSAETHASIRGVASAFGNARRGVHNVLEARRRLGTQYPMILISCVVSTENEKGVLDMIEVVRDFGADWLNMQFLNFLTPERSQAAHELAKGTFDIDEEPWRGFEIPELTKIDAGRLLANLQTIKAEARCPVSTMKIGGLTEENIRRFHYTDDVMKHHMCHMPYVTAFVVPPGEAVFCIDYPYYRYGDLRKEKLRDVWFGEKAQAFRDAYIDYYRANGKNLPQCLRCNWPYNT